MPAHDRRAALVQATLPLLREHGLAVSTRDIAAAAGVAEGTIFRVFATKDELLHEALHAAFAPGAVIERLRAVDRSGPLRTRLVDAVAVIQERFTEIFAILAAVGMVQPPEDHRHRPPGPGEHDWRDDLIEELLDIIGEDRDQLVVPADHLVRLVRLLAFSGSHPQITDHRLLTAEEIVDALLLGALSRDTPADHPASTHGGA
jgi:AcrR family transcriptional regulator